MTPDEIGRSTHVDEYHIVAIMQRLCLSSINLSGAMAYSGGHIVA
jgi:hypothetical protein